MYVCVFVFVFAGHVCVCSLMCVECCVTVTIVLANSSIVNPLIAALSISGLIPPILDKFHELACLDEGGGSWYLQSLFPSLTQPHLGSPCILHPRMVEIPCRALSMESETILV